MRADTTGLFYWACSTTGLFCCDAGRLAIAQLGYFIAAHNWVICDAGFESRTVAIAQLGYFIAAHNWVILHNWVICDAGFESRMVAIAQLGYFIAAHNWVISCSTQLGYFMKLGKWSTLLKGIFLVSAGISQQTPSPSLSHPPLFHK